MKKKVLAVLLGGCMVVGMLAGCGSNGGDTKTTDGDTKTEGSGDSKGYHFEVVVKSFQSSYWQAAVQSIRLVMSSVLQLTQQDRTQSPISLTRLTC